MSSKPSLTKTTWQAIREDVHKVNAEFANIVDDIDPGNDMPLYIAEYPYGTIIDDGDFYFPNKDGELCLIGSDSMLKTLNRDFRYCGRNIPLGMVLSKMVENHTVTNQGIAPWGIFSAGQLFALTLYMDTKTSFHPTHSLAMTSGARSIYMLPNIGDAFYHRKLQKAYGISAKTPKALDEHWDVFREISHKVNSSWSSRLLLFSEKWISSVRTKKSWSPLQAYLLNAAWSLNVFEINKRFYDLAISEYQAKRNLKPNPYITDTAKHLFALMAGGRPGFKVAHDEESAPISQIQKAYKDTYCLSYSPDLVVPAFIERGAPDTGIYYSLKAPTALEFSPRSRKDSSTLDNLRELSHITNIFLEEMQKESSIVKNTKMVELIEKVAVRFFHTSSDAIEGVLDTSTLPSYDKKSFNIRVDERPSLSSFGAFLRGCVFLSSK